MHITQMIGAWGHRMRDRAAHAHLGGILSMFEGLRSHLESYVQKARSRVADHRWAAAEHEAEAARHESSIKTAEMLGANLETILTTRP